MSDIATDRGLTAPSYSSVRAIVAAIDPGLLTKHSPQFETVMGTDLDADMQKAVSYDELAQIASAIMLGATMRHRLAFRYTLEWTQTASPTTWM